MTTGVQRRRGTTVQHSTFTGLEGEITVDTTKDTAVVHDGTTVGGHPLAKQSLSNVDPTALDALTGSNTASGDLFLVYDVSTSSLKKITRDELNNAIEQDALANVTITGGSINGTTIGASTASTGAFTTLSASGAFTANGGATLGDASGDALTINSSAVSIPNGLNFDSNTLVIDATNNRVGVGTASPSKLFELSANNTGAENNTLRLTDTATNTTTDQQIGKIEFYSSDTSSPGAGVKSYIGAFANDGTPEAYLAFATADGSAQATERMRITSAGNVGIGTSSPSAKLHVVGNETILDDGTNGRITFGASDASVNRISSTTTGFGAYRPIAYRATEHRFLSDGSTERMRLDTSGNLGIGVAPGTWASSAKAIEFSYPTYGMDSGGAAFMSFNARNSTGSTWVYKSTDQANRFVAQTDGSFAWLQAPSGTAGNAITFTQAMTLDSSGNLGVGTTSSLKYVTSAGSTATNYQFTARDTRSMAANVGGGIAFEGNDGTISDRAFGVIIGAKENATSGNYASYMSFLTRANGSAPSERMRIDSSGNVGIGTSSPTGKLEVVGSVIASGSSGALSITRRDTNAYAVGLYSASGGMLWDLSGVGTAMTLNSSGNLGLGVTPSAWSVGKAFEARNAGNAVFTNGAGEMILTANAYYNAGWKYGTTGVQAAKYVCGNTNGTHIWETAASGTAGNAITFTQAMTLDASGNLAVGTTTALTTSSGRGNITVNGSGSAIYTLGVAGASVGWFYSDTTNTVINSVGGGTAKPIIFETKTSNGESMRIDSSGNLLVGTASASARLTAKQTNDAIGAFIFANNSSYTNGVLDLECDRNTTNSSYNFIQCAVYGVAYRFYVRDSGNVVNTNNSYGAISDIKLKENIVDATPKLEDLCKVQVRQYNMKSDPDHKQLGVIAQELEEVFPAMIEETADRDADGNVLETTTKSVKYSVFVPMLIKAVQELNAKVTALEAQLNK